MIDFQDKEGASPLVCFLREIAVQDSSVHTSLHIISICSCQGNRNISIMYYSLRDAFEYKFISDLIYLGEAGCHLAYSFPETKF